MTSFSTFFRMTSIFSPVSLEPVPLIGWIYRPSLRPVGTTLALIHFWRKTIWWSALRSFLLSLCLLPRTVPMRMFALTATQRCRHLERGAMGNCNTWEALATGQTHQYLHFCTAGLDTNNASQPVLSLGRNL